VQVHGLKQVLRKVIRISIMPFAADGRVDFVAYCRLISRLVDCGGTVVTPNGNTVEFNSLFQ